MKTICLLVIEDGRPGYHERSWASLQEMLPPFDQTVRIDDSAHELGFAGAIRKGWAKVLATGADYVWHHEADFTYREPVQIARMVALLERRPELAQIVLKRQPVNAEERAAGGIVECHPDDFTEEWDDGDRFTTHRRFFSTNPSVYSTDLCRLTWPKVRFSEGVFTHQLLKDETLRFAFWGRKYDPPKVLHIGDVRAGTGY